MVQTGFTKRIKDRGFEDYVSMKKNLRHYKGGNKLEEVILHHMQTSPTSATPVDFQGNGTLSAVLSDIGKTEIAIELTADADDAATNGLIYTLTYVDSEKTEIIAVATGTATLNATPVAFVPPITDFYAPVSFESDAGAIDVIVYAQLVGGATNYGIISATTTAATDAQMIGVGQIYGSEVGAANANAGTILELEYYTPWGSEETGYCTLNANSDLVGQKLYHTKSTTIESVKDFYRIKEFKADTVAVDELQIGNLAVSAIYGGINIANYEMVAAKQFAPAASVGKLYVGDIRIANSVKSYPVIVYVYFQEKDCLVQEVLKWTLNGGVDIHIPLGFEIEPLSDFNIKIADDGEHPVVCSIMSRNILVEA